jgi:hypothetical protein
VFFPQKKIHNQKLPIQNHITKITKIAKNSCLVWCFLVDVFLFAFLLWFLYLMMMMIMKELYNMLGCGFVFFLFGCLGILKD